MSQSLSNILLHIVFSTKNRAPLIRAEIEPELYPYLTSVCNACHCPAHTVGGTDDHVHLVCSLGRTVTTAELLEEIKKSSSKWIKAKGAPFDHFSWQAGYGAFSIGQSQLDAVRRYIAGQREHHRRRTFQEEFREFLAKYRVSYDERYVWD
jgi:putative transposase